MIYTFRDEVCLRSKCVRHPTGFCLFVHTSLPANHSRGERALFQNYLLSDVPDVLNERRHANKIKEKKRNE